MLVSCDISLAGIYFPTLLVGSFLGLSATHVITRCISKFRLSKFFASPPIAYVAMLIILSVLFDSVFL